MPLGVVKLDRMAIEEAGPDPERIAASIHMQLALLSGPVPIHQVAEALDIVEIRLVPLKGLEGALVSTPERDIGSIVVNSASSAQRQRFSVAACPNSHLRSTSPACPPTRKPTLATGWCGPAVTP
jgi:hypothetical protein